MHKDVWAHTKQVVRQTVGRPLVRWAALLHDIGKVPTRTYTGDGVHFHGHAEVGARMFDKVCQRFAFARDERQTIRFLVKHHLRTNQYGDEIETGGHIVRMLRHTLLEERERPSAHRVTGDRLAGSPVADSPSQDWDHRGDDEASHHHGQDHSAALGCQPIGPAFWERP